jgi:hypothetical protein
MADQKPPQAASGVSSASLAGPIGLLCFAGVFFLFTLVALATASYAWYQLDGVEQTTQVSLTVLALAAATIGMITATALTIIGAIRWALYGAMGNMLPGGSSLDGQLLASINERLLLSDTAKRITYRHEDIQMLRQTIRDDIAKHHFDAALALVTELSQTFGHLEESESFRDQIIAARGAEVEAKISQAIVFLDESLTSHEFDRAYREAAKIERLFPESPRAHSLPGRVVQALEDYKHEMEREFLAASQHEDVDRAMELLKEMDRYLTETEAAPFREVARGVIGKKRDNLGVQFKLSVHDREWLSALRTGEQLIADFPNTKMADEVRNMLDLLRERAAGQQAAEARTQTVAP